MVKCSIHQDRDAIAICQSCGNALCSDCRITIAGVAYCQPCLDVGRIRPPTSVAEEAVDRLPTPLGNVTPSSRRNFNSGILGLALVAIFIHTFWMSPYGYLPYLSSLNYAFLIPRTIGVILVAIGITFTSFGWMEFQRYFNFRWAFYIALFTLIAPWFGVIAELLVYSGLVMIVTAPYSYITPGPLCGLFNGLVFTSNGFFGVLLILWSFTLLSVRRHSRSQGFIIATSIFYILIAHLTLLILPLMLQSVFFYPYPMVLYGYYFLIPAVLIELGVILNAIIFYRLAASLKPY